MPGLSQSVDINNPKAVVRKVFKDAVRNSIFFGVAALIVAYIITGLEWRIFGLILAIIIAIPIGINIVKYVILDLPLTILATVVLIWEKSKNEAAASATSTYFTSLLGNVFQLFENTIGLIIICYLYRAYYDKDFLGILGFFGIN
ncbi:MULTISPECIES: hypothetical protein [unclassified Paenibacillus]|uniref:hypothetical protein n=1 Tax=unclassified Paenibacillus TaxID=185978 RepID=UPI0027D8E3DA|nr:MULTISPECIES: hypothetical protein [unclassified Paenibacillus]